jgi:type IV pilus assembly protein PilB
VHCKEEYLPPKGLLKEFFSVPPPNLRWYKGQGCSQCSHTGYNGRVAVGELWTLSEQDSFLLNKQADLDSLRKSSRGNTILMAEDVMEKLQEGKTTLEELLRTLPYSKIYQFRNFT